MGSDDTINALTLFCFFFFEIWEINLEVFNNELNIGQLWRSLWFKKAAAIGTRLVYLDSRAVSSATLQIKLHQPCHFLHFIAIE